MIAYFDTSALVPLIVDEQLVRRAGQLAQERDLRGYDAVHLAGAQRVGAEDTVVATGDVQLSAAAHAVGLATTTVA